MYDIPRLVAVPHVQRHQTLLVREGGGPGEGMASVLNVLLHKGLWSENIPHELRAAPPRLYCSVTTPLMLQWYTSMCICTYTHKQTRIPGSATTRPPGDGGARGQTADTEGR